MQQDAIRIVFTDVDVLRAREVGARITDLLDRIWTSGRLRSVVASPEGVDAVRAFTDAHRHALASLSTTEGGTAAAVTVEVPVAARETVAVFARRLFALMRDPALMAAVGGVALDDEETAFIELFLRRAEGRLAAAR